MSTSRSISLFCCFLLSGFSGLVLETVWTQQLALVFGTSELALGTILAAYMGGLALGAALISRHVSRIKRPVFAYAMLELGIGLAALAVPRAIETIASLHAALLSTAGLSPPSGPGGSVLFFFATSFLVLLVPTGLMGATLPLLTRHVVTSKADIGRKVGLLYAANTAGAAGGTLVTAFLLLPRMGLAQTTWIAVSINFLVFLCATVVSRAEHGTNPATKVTYRPSRQLHWILGGACLSGAVSLQWEILWTRLLSPVLGGTIYAFAVMLATYLVGLALGSTLAARLATTSTRARWGFAYAQFAIAGLSMAAFVASEQLPRLASDTGAVSDPSGLRTALSVLGPVPSSTSLAIAALLLPSAIAIGTTFPFAVRILARRPEDAATASARVFAWNTVGAIGGALGGGYWVLPHFGFETTAVLATATSLLLALLAILASPPRARVFAGLVTASLVVLVLRPPDPPWSVLTHSSLAARPVPGEVVTFAVGRSANVLLSEYRGAWRIVSNGLPESSIASAGRRSGWHVVARWLSLLPVAARPEARSLVVVGLGAGVTVEDVPPSIEQIHVIELEPEIEIANRTVANRRRRDPLSDPRLSLHLADARSSLRLSTQRFSAIVSQPSHPWTSAASLYTREFFSLVRDRLEPDGVFVQWMALPFVDEGLLRSLLATAADVFPYVELYQPTPGAVLILAGSEPLRVDETATQAISEAQEEWARVGVLCREDLLAARVLDTSDVRRLLSEPSQPRPELVSDARNLFRMRGPGVLRRPLGSAGADRLFAHFEPLQKTIEAGTDPLYLVRRLIRQGASQRAWRLADSLEEATLRFVGLGLVQSAAHRGSEAEQAFQSALRLGPPEEPILAALAATRREAMIPDTATLDLGDSGGVWIQEVVTARRAATAGDWQTVRRAEAVLSQIEVRHPLFGAALRLRAIWRIDSGQKDLAAEALRLMSPLLAPTPEPRDLLLRARAAVAAGRPYVALPAIQEALATRQALSPALRREVRQLLRQIPSQPEYDTWLNELTDRSK